MGGGDWIEQRQEQQVQQVKKAYTEVAPSNDSYIAFQEIEVDGIDMAYAWARTFTPSWIMALIFLAGVITLGPIVLRKFGINIQFTINKKVKGKENE